MDADVQQAAPIGLSPREVRRGAKEILPELRFILRRYGKTLAPPLRDKLASLQQRLAAGLSGSDWEALSRAYDEAADCLENEAAPFRKSGFRETVEVLGLALVLALFTRAFLIQAFKIPSGSMIPTLLVGDYLLVSKLSYGIKNPFGGWVARWAEPERGDVIVFITPEDKDLPFLDRRDFIKRVIAVGRETVEFKNRTIFINGEAIEDPWGHYSSGPAFDRADYGPVVVPEGMLFMMGDNRNDSLDSRVWGFVPMDMVVGKAKILYFSFENHPWSIRWGRLGRIIN
ncbi:MAG: signal peptidase I [Bdellovibrionota bacterium]